MSEICSQQGAPGLIISTQSWELRNTLMTSSVEHLETADAVDLIGAIVLTQVAVPAMQAPGSGTIIVTGGGFADHPIPALATVSLGTAALQSAATMLEADLGSSGIRVATLTLPEAHRSALLGGRPLLQSLAGGVFLTGE